MDISPLETDMLFSTWMHLAARSDVLRCEGSVATVSGAGARTRRKPPSPKGRARPVPERRRTHPSARCDSLRPNRNWEGRPVSMKQGDRCRRWVHRRRRWEDSAHTPGRSSPEHSGGPRKPTPRQGKKGRSSSVRWYSLPATWLAATEAKD